MASDNDNAISGGLLVVLGIIVALGAVYVFYGMNSSRSNDITIRAEIPALKE